MQQSPAPRTPARPPRPPGFTEALREAAAIAALSPSSHNCQPWAHALLSSSGARAAAARLLGGDDEEETAEYLVLALDHERRLGALPAHAVEMQLSCGAYWQLLLCALDAQGWVLDALRFGDDEGHLTELFGDGCPRTWSLLSVARLRRIEGDGGTGAELAGLRATAAARRTNRARYHEGLVDPAVLRGLTAPCGAAASGALVTVRHLRSGFERGRLADFVAGHGGRDFAHEEAWRETHSFIRWSHIEARVSGDGFTLAQLFGPLSRARHRLMRTALAPSTMRLLSRVGYQNFLARQLAAMVRPTSVVVAMSLRDDEPSLADVLQGGAMLAEYWLRATRAGLALHPVSVVLQHEDVRLGLQRRLGLTGRVFFLSRLGYPTVEFPPSPRHFNSSTRTI
ncbi:RedV protein [Streptomyces sp. SID13666]|uniref:RedV protein n=1 Tax=unclassified Streptomyces TaxID=2593676 RepID=UPI001106CE3D|nr:MULTISPECIES: RedV protein [unclassified Streptomyces]NEA57195.1 RedV protein [Streptomyces sp. SID13666]NEA74289.1 RedV protein [Streptomyces sp. SID13588]QNA71952.1 RedV protein [Streptomyces sp. So13.3]